MCRKMAASNSRVNTINLSMRDKSLHKRRVSKEHNSNFRAGYVHINEEQLHKTGIRGRKRYVFYVILALLLLVAVGNLLVTIIVLGVLHIDHTGMQTLEFIPYSKLLRFIGEATFDTINVPAHSIGSYGDNSIDITADEGDIQLSVPDQSSVHLSKDGTVITSPEGLRVVDPSAGQEIFSSDTSENIHLPGNLKYLDIAKAEVSEVSTSLTDSLSVESDANVSLRGYEGLTADGKEVQLGAKTSIDIKSPSIVLDGSSGVHLEQYRRFPHKISSFTSPEISSHRVCVCMPSGKLFLVPGAFTCAQANEEANPCL